MNWITTRAFGRLFKAGFCSGDSTGWTHLHPNNQRPAITGAAVCRGASFEEIGASGALRIGRRARAVESSGRPFDVGF